MKVLVIHNFYRPLSPSGEDVVFRNEVELLKKSGIDAITYEKHNDDIEKLSKIKVGLRTIWSKETYRELKTIIKKEKPDIAHFHNIWYLISPSAYYACKDAGIPVVQTLHNFRIFCVNGLFMRNGKICEECVKKIPWRGIMYGCFRNSRLHTIPIVFTCGFHKFVGTWNKCVNAYIALTEFSKGKFIECGLPRDKIFVKPNFVYPDPGVRNNQYGKYAIFIGRISSEKGIFTLLEGWKYINNIPLKLIGDGSLMPQVKDYLAKNKVNVEILGYQSKEQVFQLLKNAMFLMVPSIWYEMFPVTIIEAFAFGVPVIASQIGAMREIVDDGRTGLLFEPNNIEDLVAKINLMIEDDDRRDQMGANARIEFEKKYTKERNYKILMEIYTKLLHK